MGQAQLLLIVLGTVVVGLAVMAGINAYEQNNIKSDLDAVVHECMRLASDAQTMAQKPASFGGFWDASTETGGYDFSTDSNGDAVDVPALGWNAKGASSNITINLTPTDGDFAVTCRSIKFPGESLTDENANTATVTLSGINADDISTVTTQFDPNPPASTTTTGA